MQDLVFIDNKQPVTSSRNVADHFEKQHKHVLEAINNLLTNADEKDRPKIGPMFYESTEPDSYGREQKVYYMNEKGFSLLVMGFKYKTGKPNAVEANKRLEAAGLMEKHGKQWRLTEAGKACGEEKPYTKDGHSGYQIVWNDSLFDALGVQ